MSVRVLIHSGQLEVGLAEFGQLDLKEAFWMRDETSSRSSKQVQLLQIHLLYLVEVVDNESAASPRLLGLQTSVCHWNVVIETAPPGKKKL